MDYTTALLHTNLCDNNPDCPVIDLCPQHAVYYDHNTLRISINESKCVACGKCFDEHCRLFEISKSDAEYKRIKKSIDSDPRQQSDLQIDRFGADIVDNAFAIDETDWKQGIKNFVSSISRLSYIEVVIQRETDCLYDCIPIASYLDMNTYRKVLIYDDIIAEQIRREFDFMMFPVVLVFSTGIMVEKIEGVYKESSNKEYLAAKLQDVQNRYKGGSV